jgi:NAD(P)-dependent dehydrogenase (short-subunit alcohol dehydrogenase family)
VFVEQDIVVIDNRFIVHSLTALVLISSTYPSSIQIHAGSNIIPASMATPTTLNHLFSVAGKSVLVSGGSRGIGLMIAKGFSDAGANVLLTSRDEKACAEAATLASCQYVVSNLSTREGCEELARRTGEVFGGKLDVLINKAGTSWGEPLERQSKTNWGFDRVLDLNVKGIFYLTRACLPLLRNHEQEDPARIINIGSVAGIMPQEAPTHAYDVSKAAVHQLTRKFAGELAREHITVNCLAPGFVPSRMSKGYVCARNCGFGSFLCYVLALDPFLSSHNFLSSSDWQHGVEMRRHFRKRFLCSGWEMKMTWQELVFT